MSGADSGSDWLVQLRDRYSVEQAFASRVDKVVAHYCDGKLQEAQIALDDLVSYLESAIQRGFPPHIIAAIVKKKFTAIEDAGGLKDLELSHIWGDGIGVLQFRVPTKPSPWAALKTPAWIVAIGTGVLAATGLIDLVIRYF